MECVFGALSYMIFFENAGLTNLRLDLATISNIQITINYFLSGYAVKYAGIEES